jgi:SAM-dependent methyltransferase
MSILPFDLPDSVQINKARLDHLNSLGLELNGRSVLEPGCGIGMLTKFWEERNCQIISTDLQRNNIGENKRRHPWRDPILRPVEFGFRELGKFDIVFCYGLLYHVWHPEKCLEDMAAACLDLLLLETRVHWMDDGGVHMHSQPKAPDQGMATQAYYPSRNWIMKALSQLFPHVYITRDQPDHPEFILRWPGTPHTSCRSVFVASRRPLNLDTLSPSLLVEQRRVKIQAASHLPDAQFGNNVSP